ncbi:MAG: 50S ribosomal protein L35 [Candidatus Bipolaricaulota bacterium]|nr:50S ribosomal protein L35 [Candidatus Bipolaricaulota bacterium]MCX6100659.1 50S ribosomal protein L35 [Candidatus Bipolaricaulota bacterium]
MPKQRTHSASKKRFTRSKSGKLFHVMSNYWHKNVKKSPKAKRHARKAKQVTGGLEKMLSRMIGKKKR